jgi:hypothetical protein
MQNSLSGRRTSEAGSLNLDYFITFEECRSTCPINGLQTNAREVAFLGKSTPAPMVAYGKCRSSSQSLLSDIRVFAPPNRVNKSLCLSGKTRSLLS